MNLDALPSLANLPALALIQALGLAVTLGLFPVKPFGITPRLAFVVLLLALVLPSFGIKLTPSAIEAFPTTLPPYSEGLLFFARGLVIGLSIVAPIWAIGMVAHGVDALLCRGTLALSPARPIEPGNATLVLLVTCLVLSSSVGLDLMGELSGTVAQAFRVSLESPTAVLSVARVLELIQGQLGSALGLGIVLFFPLFCAVWLLAVAFAVFQRIAEHSLSEESALALTLPALVLSLSLSLFFMQRELSSGMLRDLEASQRRVQSAIGEGQP